MNLLCPQCQQTNRDDANFCRHCGHHFALSCPRCRQSLLPDSRFCDRCGEAIAGAAAALPAPTPSARPTPPPVAGAGRLQQFIPQELMNKLAAARAAGGMVGERRVVTMLFCDVKGSTAAAGQLDPEEWTEIINGAFEYMIRPVYAYEGIVARLMGDAILAFFGAPIAHEDDPQRAVLAGLGIVEGIQAYRDAVRQRWGIDFNVRVGINTGMVVVGAVGSDLRLEYTAMGDAINLAARMEQMAAPGTVQIAEDTFRMVADLFEFEALGGIDVKGKSAPVSAYRVHGRRRQTASRRGLVGHEAPLVGRAGEWARLRAAGAGLQRGVGQVVLLVGEAGLGKSRLIHELQQDLARAGAGAVAWYETASLSYENTQPYGLFQRLMRRLAQIGPEDRPALAREKMAVLVDGAPIEGRDVLRQVLVTLFGLPPLADETPLTGEAFRDALYAAMVDLWRRRTAAAPAVLVFDDIHWSDEASVALLAELLSLTASLPLLILLASRPDRAAPAWGLRAALAERQRHRFIEIEVRPLTPADSDELVDHLLHGLPDRLRRRIQDRADGNPFFVEEVVRALIDRGAVVPDETGWRVAAPAAELEIPENLHALLVARIDRLEENTRRTLQLAALIGRSFYYRVLQRILAETPAPGSSELAAQLDTLQAADIIREAARQPELEYTFRHALTQEAAYQTILLKQRRAYHRRVAEAIAALFPEQLEEHAPMLAFHFQEAEAFDQALHYFRLAGDVAFRLYALDAAGQHYGQAIAIAGRIDADSAAVQHLYRQRGRALELTMDHQGALANYDELLALAEARDDDQLRLSALFAKTIVLNSFNPAFDTKSGPILAEEALALAQRLGDKAAEARICWTMMLAYGFGRAEFIAGAEYGQRSLALVRELGDEEQLPYTLNDLGRMTGFSGQVAAGLKYMRSARSYFEARNDLPMLVDNLNGTSILHVMKGEFEQAESIVQQALAIAESNNNTIGLRDSRWVRCLGLIEWGEYGRAHANLNEIWAQHRDDDGITMNLLPYVALADTAAFTLAPALSLLETNLNVVNDSVVLFSRVYYAQLARLYIQAGRLDDAETMMGRCGRPEYGRLRSAFELWPIIGDMELALAQGRHTAVLNVAEPVRAYIQQSELAWQVPDILLNVAAAELRAGDRPAARATLAETVDMARATNSRRNLWPALAALADLSDDPAAAAALRAEAKAVVETIARFLVGSELHDTFVAAAPVRALAPDL